MKIELIDLTVRELVDGYFDDGVGGYGERLDFICALCAMLGLKLKPRHTVGSQEPM